MSKYTEIDELLLAIPTIKMRKSRTSVFTTQKPVWELLYDGRYRYANGWADRWIVEVWGGRDDVPNSQEELARAVAIISDALLEVDSIEFDDVRVATEIPEHSKVRFTHAEIPIRELCVNGQ